MVGRKCPKSCNSQRIDRAVRENEMSEQLVDCDFGHSYSRLGDLPVNMRVGRWVPVVAFPRGRVLSVIVELAPEVPRFESIRSPE